METFESARIQTADIGLKGMMLPTPDSDPTPGFQVHLGGGLATVDRGEAGLTRPTGAGPSRLGPRSSSDAPRI